MRGVENGTVARFYKDNEINNRYVNSEILGLSTIKDTDMKEEKMTVCNENPFVADFTE